MDVEDMKSVGVGVGGEEAAEGLEVWVGWGVRQRQVGEDNVTFSILLNDCSIFSK